MATNAILDGYASLKRELNLLLADGLKKFPFGHKQMMVLYIIGRDGPQTMGALAAYTQSDKATITRAIASLEKNDFIRRESDKEDTRVTIIRLTPKGKAHSDKALKVREHIGQRVDQTLTAAERATVAALLTKIVTGLQAKKEN